MKELKARIEQLRTKFNQDLIDCESIHIHEAVLSIMERPEQYAEKILISDNNEFGYTVFSNKTARYVPVLEFIGQEAVEKASPELFSILHDWCTYFVENGALAQYEHGAVRTFEFGTNSSFAFTTHNNPNERIIVPFHNLLSHALQHLFERTVSDENKVAGFPYGLWSEFKHEAYYRAPNPVGETYSEFSISKGHFVTAGMLGVSPGYYANETDSIFAFEANPEMRFCGMLYAMLQVELIKSLIFKQAQSVCFEGLDGLDRLRELRASEPTKVEDILFGIHKFVAELGQNGKVDTVQDSDFQLFMNLDTYLKMQNQIAAALGGFNATSGVVSTQFLGKINGVNIVHDAKMGADVIAITLYDKNGLVFHENWTI